MPNLVWDSAHKIIKYIQDSTKQDTCCYYID